MHLFATCSTYIVHNNLLEMAKQSRYGYLQKISTNQYITHCYTCAQRFLIRGSTVGVHLAPELKSLTEPSCRPPAGGVQGFQQVSDQQSSINTIGRPLMHMSALVQASGEACYVDDIPQYEVELHAGLVLSTHTHAKICVDWSAALSVAGVQGYVSAEDVPGSNVTGVFADEVVFAEGEVTFIGQVIGMILAEDRMIARRAAKLVKVSYTDLPSVITIEVVNLKFHHCGDIK